MVIYEFGNELVDLNYNSESGNGKRTSFKSLSTTTTSHSLQSNEERSAAAAAMSSTTSARHFAIARVEHQTMQLHLVWHLTASF
jgi:hypothetical protein